MMKTILGASVLAISLSCGAAFAAEHEIKMLNKGESGAMVFEPAFVKAEVGDTVKFVPVDKGHNAASIKGMLPEGIEKFSSKFNKEFTLNIEKEGLYGIKCTPHYGMGMVALIATPSPENEEEAKAVKHRGKAKKRFDAIFEEYEASK